jgi:hypothetical protein
LLAGSAVGTLRALNFESSREQAAGDSRADAEWRAEGHTHRWRHTRGEQRDTHTQVETHTRGEQSDTLTGGEQRDTHTRAEGHTQVGSRDTWPNLALAITDQTRLARTQTTSGELGQAARQNSESRISGHWVDNNTPRVRDVAPLEPKHGRGSIIEPRSAILSFNIIIAS